MNRKTDLSFSLAIDDDADVQAAAALLTAHVEKDFGPAGKEPYALLARRNGKVVGLAKGTYHWQWLYIAQLWVAEEERSQGLGKKLLQEAETFVRDRKGLGLYLDTFDARAREFYLREGFQEFGKLPGMPKDGVRHFLSKKI